jgi:hypothetical protein
MSEQPTAEQRAERLCYGEVWRHLQDKETTRIACKLVASAIREAEEAARRDQREQDARAADDLAAKWKGDLNPPRLQRRGFH